MSKTHQKKKGESAKYFRIKENSVHYLSIALLYYINKRLNFNILFPNIVKSFYIYIQKYPIQMQYINKTSLSN